MAGCNAGCMPMWILRLRCLERMSRCEESILDPVRRDGQVGAGQVGGPGDSSAGG